MCYPKPGPRCSNHTKWDFKRASLAAQRNPNDRRAQAALAEAKEAYFTSPEGIERLNKKAEEATDPAEAEKYRKDAEHYAQKRQEQLKNYNDVKHLPATTKHERDHGLRGRREWDYDKESGYADGWDVEANTDNEPLINVHTGKGEDYLEANKLTELYGWTTDDAEGSEEEPIYLDRTAEGGELETVAVRSVELENVVTGESRTIYRLDQGDGSFNTFGSREEVEAEVSSKFGGEVISQRDWNWRYEEEIQSVFEHDAANEWVPSYRDSMDDDSATDDDSDGFDSSGFLSSEYVVRNENTGLPYEPVTKSGHSAGGFKIADYDESRGQTPSQRLSYHSAEFGQSTANGAEYNPEILEDMDTKDATLPFHHEETGTLFNREGKDYWGRTRDEAKAALQESLASGEW